MVSTISQQHKKQTARQRGKTCRRWCISIGTAALYDLSGPLGTCVVTTMSNVRRQIDFTVRTPSR